MRVIHSSDWHLGHMLRGEVTREYEHHAFLRWLLETCVREAADVLLVTGDVFDAATPPASAERMWFDFLAGLRRVLPALDIIAIAGNHDSPARLGAPSAVLRELGVHVIGALPRTPSGAIDLDRVVIPVGGGRGLVAAVPFLRPVDFDGQLEDPLTAIYGEVLAGARARRSSAQALIVTGHLYVAGADTQYLSERRVSIGGQESAPLRLFPEDISYVALGHIHRAQRVGRDTIRYAGAPLALAFDEAGYTHQVLAIDFAGPAVAAIRALPVPRAVELLRVPRRGAAPLAAVLRELEALPALDRPSGAARSGEAGTIDRFSAPLRGAARSGEAGPIDRFSAPLRGAARSGEAPIDPAAPARPYLEVVVALEKPEPNLRTLVEAALDGKHPRLVYLHAQPTGDRAALGDRADLPRRLAEIDPRDVFARLWGRDHAQPPDAEVLAAFERLLEDVRGDREDLAS